MKIALFFHFHFFYLFVDLCLIMLLSDVSLRLIRFQRHLSQQRITRTLLFLYCLRKRALIYLQACLVCLELLFVKSRKSQTASNCNFPNLKSISNSSVIIYSWRVHFIVWKMVEIMNLKVEISLLSRTLDQKA